VTEPRLAPLAGTIPCPVLYAGLFLWVACLDRHTGHHSLYIHRRCSTRTRDCLDHWRQTSSGQPGRPGHWRMTDGFTAEQSAQQFQRDVTRIKAYIDAGDCYQVNLSQRFAGRYRGDTWQAFDALSRAHPTPFAAYLKVGGQSVLSFSPERFLSIRNGRVLTSPIKGTRARGETPEQDEALRAELRSSVKDKAENLMIVDLLRNDLGRHCQTGTVSVPGLFEVETYRNVHHLVSHVEGRLKPDIRPFQAFLDAFPGGSITGAPKIRAMEIIRELEPHWRGPYCGSVFYWGLNGNLDSSIAIRTLLCDGAGRILCWGGGGIVADSDPQAEYEETLTKVRPLMSFLESL
ncbi:MAG: aminodeoxychorismate synthase component I, partial [Marinobacter sp.]|nr:aminodeoxychorismate synthase component I [Marinobacter sp.]